MILSILFALTAATASAPADSAHCTRAAAFLRGTQHMVAEIETDTFDDWRTHKRVPGCRITAAGASDLTVRNEAVRLYERLRAAGYTRTPEPRDSPNEASLRFRMSQSDCLFHVNTEAMLGTDAEGRVNDLVKVAPGMTRYQVFVMCMPAMPAADRSDSSSALAIAAPLAVLSKMHHTSDPRARHSPRVVASRRRYSGV